MKWRDRANIGLIKKHELPQHYVREYANRIAVWRKDGKNQTWEELQAVKNQILGADTVAIEIYPEEKSVVNIKPTRHLWLLPPLLLQGVMEECTHIEFINKERESE